jgi:hypothetical protein
MHDLFIEAVGLAGSLARRLGMGRRLAPTVAHRAPVRHRRSRELSEFRPIVHRKMLARRFSRARAENVAESCSRVSPVPEKRLQTNVNRLFFAEPASTYSLGNRCTIRAK